MKKPVILIIGLIYALAIVVVGFLGIKARVFNEKVYVNDITFAFDENLTQRKSPEGVDYYFTIPDVGNTSFDITAKVVPNNATVKQCTFTSLNDINDDPFYTINSEFNGESTIGTIVCNGFNKYRTICLKVSPNDGNKQLYKTLWIFLI